MANRLAGETSPYLLQHKDNPVDWYPWGPEAIDKATTEDKPLLVSIGYSACHWCHVMAHESFEDAETAALMNERFVNVKVDREERPDIDSIYMTAVQAMTGHGGWPLNAFITAEGVPFYGGTYWPPSDRSGLPGFRKVLEAVSDAYKNKREDVLENAEQIRGYLVKASQATPEAGELNISVLEDAFRNLTRSFDGENGGFGGAPKFPQPATLEFLLRYYRRTNDERAEKMVRLTLDKMAAGGMYDQVGGGFHRYAVDAIWLVPHFEKMLYDNAQLARVYLDAYRAFGDENDKRVATETLDYVAREMTSPEGGFYSTQDADSDGEEGKFFVWSPEEIEDVVGDADAPIVRRYFGVASHGNFEGHSILNVPISLKKIADEFGMSEGRLSETIASAKKKLYEAREKRIHPGRDEKIITGWNGMMMRAFAEASRVLSRADYRDVARRNAEFLLTKLRDGKRILHTYKDGKSKLNGFLDDYANLIDGLNSLYEATFERRWIEEALALTETMIAEFADPEGVGFFDTGVSHETLVSRPRELHDGATPAGNSVAASVLLKLSVMTENEEYAERAAKVLAAMARPMEEQPTGFGRFLAALESYFATPREIAIAGRCDDSGVNEFAETVFGRYEPDAVLGLADPADESISSILPFLEYRPMKGEMVAAYLCERHACMPPVTEPEALIALLSQGTGVSWQEF